MNGPANGRFADRAAAGRLLGARLASLRLADPVLLGLPRGGVPVAAAVRDVIGGDLDVLLVRKLGVPQQPELAMGAISEHGVRVLNADVLKSTGTSQAELADVQAREQRELERRARQLRPVGKPIPLRGRDIVVIDDGIATGATARAACQAARLGAPARLVLAAPVIAGAALAQLAPAADTIVSVQVAAELRGVGAYYRDFHQLDDAEVWNLLGS